MRLPIRNKTAAGVTLFIEPHCDQHEIPAGGEAIVILEDGRPHSIDVHADRWISLWDEGSDPIVKVTVHEDQDHSGKR